MTKIELLAPAKNIETGKVAINYGADAVYIGANDFGARAGATNSVEDIKELVKYAHKYGAKVFVTLNTILYDDELEKAEKLIYKIYQTGADALIIQDMGILNMDIPPIPLHASTQANNFKLDRIQFLDKIGFERIILARELSLREIKNIRKQTKTELEFFVHGALCVSLSGQCYFSQVVTGRSANRGMCAQMCRHPYNLVDADGNKIALNSHLLSLKDLNLSNELEALIEAGITSLKIEGRLKDINYVKNVVSYYRKKLDEIFRKNAQYSKSSSGNTQINFEPDPDRSFNRQSSNYFLSGRDKGLVNASTPKSMGKRMGIVTTVNKDYITVKSGDAFHNGDGLCFVKKNELVGLRVEKVIGNKVFIKNAMSLKPGDELYRNYDHDFNKALDADKSIRKVTASILVKEEGNQFQFILTDEDKLSSKMSLEKQHELAKYADMASKNMVSQFSKSGNSMFHISDVDIQLPEAYFFRMSELNEIRRSLFQKQEELRISTFVRKDIYLKKNNLPYPQKELDFSANVSNIKAKEFYLQHGAKVNEDALEVASPKQDQLLMTTRYCIKYELGYCERFQNAQNTPAEPLYLEDHNRKYLLDFDCKSCFMKIRLHNE